jgi:hypothetical protein
MGVPHEPLLLLLLMLLASAAVTANTGTLVRHPLFAPTTNIYAKCGRSNEYMVFEVNDTILEYRVLGETFWTHFNLDWDNDPIKLNGTNYLYKRALAAVSVDILVTMMWQHFNHEPYDAEHVCRVFGWSDTEFGVFAELVAKNYRLCYATMDPPNYQVNGEYIWKRQRFGFKPTYIVWNLNTEYCV